MVSRILVDGFKSIDRAELDLGMFTLLSGVNSAGKSSIIYGPDAEAAHSKGNRQ